MSPMARRGDKKGKGDIVIRREEAVGGEGHGGAWKVAYADFVTAMMAFFLLMWLLNATTEEQRKGLADYFSPSAVLSHNSSGNGQPFGGKTAFSDGAMASDRGTVHEDEGAGRSDAPKAADVAMHAVDQPRPLGLARLFLDRPDAVVEQRPVDEPRPAVQHRDHLLREIAEPPASVRLDRQLLVVALQRVVKVDDASDKARRKDADAAEIEQVHGAVGRDRVIAEMRVAVDHPVKIERHVPHPEHPERDLVAQFRWRFFGYI